jgi:SagB-type dehydrogenase family enzyme
LLARQPNRVPGALGGLAQFEKAVGRRKNMESMETYRKFLKADRWDEWAELETDQRKKIPPPSPQKPSPKDATLIELVVPKDLTVGKMPLIEAISRRKSHRKFTKESLTLEELSFLLWATQGVREVSGGGAATRRTVPSGGSRHPFETYLLINRVNGLEPGFYRYLPLEHKLCFLWADAELTGKVNDACRGQTFVGEGAVVFIWTVIPYRAEWRYSFVAHKMIAMDAGHLCQNLYLASEAIGAGTCAVGAYNQNEMDTIVGVDGRDEFVIYVAPVGKIK